MGLRSVSFQVDYRTGPDSLVRDFFGPALREAREYWRAVGYFSSSSLEAFGAPLGDFLKNQGRIRLVTSVELSEADLRAIENGTHREEVCACRLEQIIESEFADGAGDGTARLARLLELGRLEIQIAVPKTGTGIYHEKLGLFIDNGDFVAFTGSSNESRNAFENNRECIDVYLSWKSTERALRKRAHFEALWNRTDEGVDVFAFPEAAKKKLLRICRERSGEPENQDPQSNKWRHQEEALEAFLKAERGVLDMATGTGKTRTALKILRALFARDAIDTVIISTDGNDLLDQWYGELLATRNVEGRNLRVFRHYRDRKERGKFFLRPEDAILLSSREPLAAALRQISSRQAHRTLLVHDEVHGLGSPGNRERLQGLSDDVRFRLGLSATPEREYDQDGNDFISSHIGPVLMTFGLEEAISRGILAPFKYYPLQFALTDSDRERVSAVYRRRAARKAAGDPMSDKEVWIEIARVYKTSEAKLPIFADFVSNHPDLLTRCIIFTETMEFGGQVLDIVHQHRPDFHTYFSGDQVDILREFARGDLECLITCHRLSEGIDIKSLNTVMLLSSDKARLETIQRIGRCLRTDPDDPAKMANVLDFIHNKTGTDGPSPDEERCKWLTQLSKVRPKETGV